MRVRLSGRSSIAAASTHVARLVLAVQSQRIGDQRRVSAYIASLLTAARATRATGETRRGIAASVRRG